MFGMSRTSAASMWHFGHARRSLFQYAATSFGRWQVGSPQWLASFQVAQSVTHG